MNRHFIIGNLVRDPEVGTSDGGHNYARFVVAVNRSYKRDGEPDADFMRVTAWGSLGDSCGRYLTKGKKVAVIGESRASAWKTQDGEPRSQIEITARDVEFLTPKGTGNGAPPQEPGYLAGKGNGQGDGSGAGQGKMQVVDPEDVPW